MKSTIIVHGPAGCGKTRNREKIAKKLTGDSKNYVDDVDNVLRGQVKVGAVYLTIDADRMREMLAREGIDDVRIIPFSKVMAT